MCAEWKVACVVGARPNFMKMAPAISALREHPGIRTMLVHTGQHYDVSMSDTFISQLNIEEPKYRLDVGSGSHAQQTARVIERIEPILQKEAPDVLLVAGDVNSTLAASIVASKLRIPIAHIEAGLRSFDRDMPEEINRIIVDRISDILYTTEESGRENLIQEGISSDCIIFVGNLMIDTLRISLEKAIPARSQIAERFGESCAQEIDKGYAVLTLHRPSNVDDLDVLRGILSAIGRIASEIPILFPVHPRTLDRMAAVGGEIMGLYSLPPLGYREMLGLLRGAKLVLTDSGGIQEETTALGIPCLTLRNNTERPITVEQGTNSLVGTDPRKIVASAQSILRGQIKSGTIPSGWDGHAAERLASHLVQWLTKRKYQHVHAKATI